MSSEFMPMALDSLARQQSARAAGSGASSRITEEELEELGIPVNKPGENDMGLDFNDFLQLMVQQLQNQTIDNTTDTGEMLNQLVQMSTVQMLSSVKTGLETLVDASTLTYAASLVGKTVTVGQYDEDGKLQEIEGVVTGTGNYQGVPVIFVNDEMYPLPSDYRGRHHGDPVGREPQIPSGAPDDLYEPKTPGRRRIRRRHRREKRAEAPQGEISRGLLQGGGTHDEKEKKRRRRCQLDGYLRRYGDLIAVLFCHALLHVYPGQGKVDCARTVL